MIVAVAVAALHVSQDLDGVRANQGSNSPVKISASSVDNQTTNKNRREYKERGSRDDVEETDEACNPPKS